MKNYDVGWTEVWASTIHILYRDLKSSWKKTLCRKFWQQTKEVIFANIFCHAPTAKQEQGCNFPAQSVDDGNDDDFWELLQTPKVVATQAEKIVW